MLARTRPSAGRRRGRRGRTLDRDLVEQAQRGDEAAFGLLAVRISDRLYAIAYHLLRDSARADDAAQQAMIDIWRHLPALSDPDRFASWTYRIVVRAAYAEARSRGVWEVRGAAPSAVPASGDQARAVADRDEIERGFARLSLDHRAVLVLKHYLDLPNDQIASVLEIPEGTVRSRLHLGLKALRAAIEADARLPSNEAR
jgi:RNA polymerase sigma-70 factor, ECF subfamily